MSEKLNILFLIYIILSPLRVLYLTVYSNLFLLKVFLKAGSDFCFNPSIPCMYKYDKN